MTESIHRSETLEDVLGPAGEAEWQRLRRQLEFADGFWLGFLFASSPLNTAALRQRAEQLLRIRVRTMQVIQPKTPEALRTALSTLFEKDTTHLGCLWLESLHADTSTLTPTALGPWTAAWDDLLLRLNERRDALRRHLTGGLLLVAPPEIRPRVRDAAPDLWSVRTLVMELPLVPRTLERETSRNGMVVERLEQTLQSATTPDVEMALAEARRLTQKKDGDPRVYATLLLRAVEGLLEQERAQEAIGFARDAVDTLQQTPSGYEAELSSALAQLSRAEAMDGDLPLAREHIERALAVKEASLAHQEQQESAFRELSLMLDQLVSIETELNDFPAALATCEKEIALDRQLRDTLGESPQTLRDLSISLGRLGLVQQAEGNYEEAARAYEEALTLDRQRMHAYGELPQTLRDCIFNLGQMSQLRRSLGDEVGAAAADQEREAIKRQLAMLSAVETGDTGKD